MHNRILNYSIIGKIMILVGILVLAPVIIIPFFPKDIIYLKDFLYPSIISIILGLIICRINLHKSKKGYFSWKKSSEISYLIVILAWIWGIFIGAIPFIMGGYLNFIQAIFESVSAWTTTGLSVMDVSKTAHIFLFHRSFMQYCGGFGFMLMMVMLVSGKQSMQLFNAEGHPDKLMPNLKKTSRLIIVMYNIFLVLGTFAYKIGGMNYFDGITHTMCALSTGGFSTKLNSIGYFNSFYVNLVTIVLMIIGTTNFAVILLLLKGKVKKFLNVSEVKFMFLFMSLSTILVAWSVSDHLNIKFIDALKSTSVDVISAISTTGFSTMSYSKWPQFSIGLMIVLMIIGGGLGSTAGGIKIQRACILSKIAVNSIKARINTENFVDNIYIVKAQGKVRIDEKLEKETVGFALCYLLFFITGTLLISLTAKSSITNAMFEFSSALSTVGLSIGITGPNTNSLTLIIEILGMFFGRLEILVVLAGIHSVFNIALRKKKSINNI